MIGVREDGASTGAYIALDAIHELKGVLEIRVRQRFWKCLVGLPSLQAWLHVERRAFECASINDEIADHRHIGKRLDDHRWCRLFPTRENRLAVHGHSAHAASLDAAEPAITDPDAAVFGHVVPVSYT